jgi:hypothetical protein
MNKDDREQCQAVYRQFLWKERVICYLTLPVVKHLALVRRNPELQNQAFSLVPLRLWREPPASDSDTNRH